MSWTRRFTDRAIRSIGPNDVLPGTVSNPDADGFVVALADGESGVWRIEQAEGDPYTFSQVGQDLPLQDWRQVSPATSPPARAHFARYDGAAQSNVDFITYSSFIFGGVDGGGTELNDFWAWNGLYWHQITSTHSPPVRQGAVMFFGTVAPPSGFLTFTGILLFGGQAAGTPLNDIWTWNKTDWVQLHPTHSPPARYNTTVCSYSRVEGNGERAVMFGGVGSGGAVLNDTWVWDYTPDWIVQSPGNSPGQRESMFAVGGIVNYNDPLGNDEDPVFFGGKLFGTYFNDAWQWHTNGSGTVTNWIQLSPTHNFTARAGALVVGSSQFLGTARHGEVIMFGGEGVGGVPLNDTWVLNSGGGQVDNVGTDAGGQYTWAPIDWTEITSRLSHHPTARAYGALFQVTTQPDPSLGSSPTNNLALLFGGIGSSGAILNDTWTIDPGANSGIGNLARVGGELWFTSLRYTEKSPWVRKYDPVSGRWVPVGDGGGPGSQFDAATSFSSNSEVVTADGYLAFNVKAGGVGQLHVFKFVDPNWVEVGDRAGLIAMFPNGTGTPDVIADATDGLPVITAVNNVLDVAPGAIVAKFNGSSWVKLGTTAMAGIAGTTRSGIADNRAFRIFNRPGSPGQYAFVATALYPDTATPPFIAFWNGTSWSAPVAATLTDYAISGSPWVDEDSVYAAMLMPRNDAGTTDVYIETVRIPWGGTAWTGYPSSPPQNYVTNPSDFGMFRIRQGATPVFAINSSGVAAVLSGSIFGIYGGLPNGAVDLLGFQLFTLDTRTSTMYSTVVDVQL